MFWNFLSASFLKHPALHCSKQPKHCLSLLEPGFNVQVRSHLRLWTRPGSLPQAHCRGRTLMAIWVCLAMGNWVPWKIYGWSSYRALSMAIDSFMSQKKMVKWGFQGVYVCMLLVMILCCCSMCVPWFWWFTGTLLGVV